MMRLIVGMLLTLLAPAAFCQSLGVGIKAGMPLTDAVSGSLEVESIRKNLVIGPMIEVRLPFGLAVEANALYRRIGYDSSRTELGTTTTSRIRANAWELPIMGKMGIGPHLLPVRFFAGVGYATRYVTNVSAELTQAGIEIPVNTQFLLANDPIHGMILTTGGEFKVPFLVRIVPEIRYTRWGSRSFDEQGSRGFYAQSSKNQLDLLVGFQF